MEPDAAERAARIFFEARQRTGRIAGLPVDLRPRVLGEVQDIIGALTRMTPEPVAGWKFATQPEDGLCAAPLHASRIFPSPAALPRALVPSLWMEAEIAFRLSRDLPARADPYTEDEVFDAVRACAAIELVESRFQDIKGLLAERPSRRLEVLADQMSHGAFVFGELQDGWHGRDFAGMRVTMTQGDAVLADQVGGHPNTHPAQALPRFANWMRSRGGLAAGMYLATGSFTGFRVVAPELPVTVCFEGFGSAMARVRD